MDLLPSSNLTAVTDSRSNNLGNKSDYNLGNLSRSYPGDACVEDQTATGFQNQHGVYILKKEMLLSDRKFSKTRIQTLHNQITLV